MRSLRSPFLQGGEYVTDMILWIKHVLHPIVERLAGSPCSRERQGSFTEPFPRPARRSRRRFSVQTN